MKNAKHVLNICLPYLVLLLAYVLIYRYVIFFPHLMDGPDWQFPLASHLVAWNNIFSAWDPLGIGAPSRFSVGFTIYNYVFRGFISVLAFGDMLIQQKIWLSAFFIASVGMYTLSINHLTKVKLAAFTAALIYGFSPLMTVNIGTGNIWEIAFLPFTFNYIMNICSRKRGRDILLLPIFMSLQFNVGLHTLVLLPVMIAIIWASYIPQAKDKLNFIKSTFTRLMLAFCLFVIMNPNLVFLGLEVYGITHFYSPVASAQGVTYGVPEVSMEGIIRTYQSVRPLTSFFTMSAYLHEDLNINIPVLGIVIPVVGFAGLIYTRGSKKLLSLALAICIIVDTYFVLLVVNGHPIYAWLFKYFLPIREMNGPFAPVVYLSLFMSSLVASSLGQVATAIHARPVKGKQETEALMKWNKLLTVSYILRKYTCPILCLLVLSSFFAFNPAFTLRSQVLGEGYHESDALIPYPSVYSELTPYLGNAGQPNDFRYLIIPSTFTSGNSLHRNYPSTPSVPNSDQAISYTNLLGTSLTAKQDGWGSLLDIASIRYIIITNNTSEPSLYTYRVQDPPKYIPSGIGMYIGNPDDFKRIVAQEAHLRLIQNGSDFWVYENLNYVPHIATFSRLTYVFGDIRDLTKISSIPGYTSSDSVMVFHGKNTSSMIERADTIAFINLNPLDIAIQQVNNNLITEIYGKNILYLFYKDKLDKDILKQGVSFYLPTSTQCTVAIGTRNATNSMLRPDVEVIVDLYRFAQDNGTFSNSWINATAIDNRMSAVFSPILSGIETSGRATVTIPIHVQSSGSYDIALNRLIIPGHEPKGLVQVSVNDEDLQPPTLKHGIGWYGRAQLLQGYNNITITSSDGHVILSQLFLIRSENFEFFNRTYAELLQRPFSFSVDGVPIKPVHLDAGEGWLWLRMQLSAGEHTVALENSYESDIDRMIVYTGESISDLFGQTQSVAYSVLSENPEEYVVRVKSSSPSYVILSDSYNPNWRAYTDETELQHFEAFSLSNAFVIDQGGSHLIRIRYADSIHTAMIWIGLGTFISSIIVLISIALLDMVGYNLITVVKRFGVRRRL